LKYCRCTSKSVS